MGLFDKYETLINQTETVRSKGQVIRVQGLMVESQGPICKIGECCTIFLPGGRTAQAEVIGFNEKRVQLMPLTDISGIVPGCEVYAKGHYLEVLVGDELLGRVLNGVGQPLDGKTLNFYWSKRSVFAEPISVFDRKIIREKLYVGVRALDGLLTLGKGQRIGIFSGSGVGKSTLLSMIARNTEADVIVIGLIGERRREVQEFIERDLGPEGLKKAVVVVATSDDPPLARVRGVYTATTIAEYFRDQGKNVLLIVDSITRASMAQREIGTALGEIPISRGYPPSVFTMLPKILERAGTSSLGTITGIYNVLLEGGDMEEPISDAIRGILDGHIILSRKLAIKNHYPPIVVTESVSRLMMHVADPEHLAMANNVKEWMAAYEEVEDLINIGAYVRGANPLVDQAIVKMPEIRKFLKQGIYETTAFPECQTLLDQLVHGRARSGQVLRTHGAPTTVRIPTSSGNN